MAPCSTIVRLLLDFVEDRLPAGDREALEQHLSCCPSCVAHVNTYRSTVSLLHSISEDDLPPELRLSLSAFLDQGSRN